MGLRLWQSGFRRPAWIAALLLAAAVDFTMAQEPASPAEPSGAEPASARPSDGSALPGEVLPKVYVLKDKLGNLQAMPGIAFEEFMELYRLKNQLDQQNEQPRYSIQNLILSGSAASQRAELTAQCTLMLNVAGWVRVPLRLSGAVLREAPSVDGAGEHAVQFEPEGEGYVFWVRGEPGKAQQITLKLLVRLSQIGPETHLRLSLPRSAMSQLQLQVPLERAVARVSEGSTLDSTQPLEGGKTQFKFVGVGGEVDVSWRPAESPLAGLPTVLEASGVQTIRINGRSINTETKLSVHSFGGEFDRFQVRLPPGADYVGTAQAGISLAPIEAAGGKGKLYEIKLEKKTSGPVEVRLITERAHNSPQADEMLELAGFEVLGAVRQWGTIAVQVEGNWQILWGELAHVRQVNELLRSPRRDDLTAAFEYFVQPYSLPGRVVPQKTRVSVEPEYVLLVGGSETQLRAKFKYTIRGAKIRALELDLPGWELDLVGPANLVNIDAAVPNQASSVVIPLWQATSGELELSLEAHQKISAESPNVALELPRPRAEVIAPAMVAVLPADNIELAVRADETAALAPQTVRPQIKLPERQQDPLYFRTEGPAPKLVASIKTHQQAISAALATQLELDESETRVEQRVTYQVAYQPTDHLVLGVPRAIRSDRLKVSLDGQRLLPVLMREPTEGDAAELVSMRVVLPAPRIGRCELQISYVVGHEKLPSVGNTQVNVPLVVPGEGQLTDNELVVVPKTGVSVSYSKGPWREEIRDAAAANGSGLTLTARRALREIGLTVSSKERPIENATTIERAWIQTRMTGAEREDRMICRFTTGDTRLKISLPPGVEPRSLEMQIDGRRLTPEFDRQRELSIALSGVPRSEHWLELRYRFAGAPTLGPLSLACPQLKPGGWTRQLYWQLVLPENEHVLFAPARYTREFSWVWSGLFWQRQSPLEQRELESWVGAASPGTAPSGDPLRMAGETDEQFAARQRQMVSSTNRYLFSTVGTVAPLEVYLVSRARLVFLASLPLLLGGLLLIYFPSARHPGMLFAVALVVLSASLVDGESALLFAQASGLGLVLAVAAAVMARVSVRPRVATIPARGSSKAIERTPTEMYQRASGSRVSTATNPLVPAAPPEGES